MNTQTKNTSAGDPLAEKSFVREVYNDNPPDYVGDAIEISPCPNDLMIQAHLHRPYSKDLDEFEGKFLKAEQKERFEQWTKGYSQFAKGYIGDNIEDESSETSYHNAKVGFVACNSGAGSRQSSLCIRPVNHLISVAFNRRLARDRINYDTSSQAHKIWKTCFSNAINTPTQTIEFSCPSQLFIELGLVTVDNFVPITHKSNRTSVYAMRNNHKPLETCGLESGLNWKDSVIATNNDQVVNLDVLTSVVAGLEREFPMPDWDTKINQLEITLKSYALQTLHLNTAILGYCKVPYTKSQLNAELKGKICGGLNHSKLNFLPVGQCREYAEKYRDSTAWHASAMMRLRTIADSMS